MKPTAVALCVAAAVAGGVWWLREPAEVAPVLQPPRLLAEAQVGSSPTPTTAAEPASAELDDLRAMSQSVRNGTFVIAIRAAGFTCEDVVEVYAGDGAPAWRARCRDSHAYYLRVADAGGLTVEPTIDYFDGQAVLPVDRNRPDPAAVPLELRR